MGSHPCSAGHQSGQARDVSSLTCISHQLPDTAADATTPSGVFSLRGARRTVKYDSAPREARPESPGSSVASAMAPDSRRRDDGDVAPSPRIGNDEDGAMPPQPFGPMGIAADLFVARRRRCSSIDFLLAPRPRLTSPIGGRHWGPRPDLMVENPAGRGTSPPSP